VVCVERSVKNLGGPLGSCVVQREVHPTASRETDDQEGVRSA